MGKASPHRWLLRLKRAVIGVLLLQEVFAPWAVAPAFAQNSDSMVVGVVPTSTAAPAAITDLLASANPVVEGQIALTWTAPQGNAGGIPIPNWTVAAYMVHVATFSVDSLLGDTTSWWNSTSAGSALLQAPGNPPHAPGQPEAYTFTGLTPGSTFYFAVRSISQGGVTSPIDVNAATVGLQASAVSTKFSGSLVPPMQPNGLFAANVSGQVSISWHAVTLDADQQPVTIDHYVVDRYDAIGSSATASITVPASTTLFSETVGGLTYYYRVKAVSTSGAVSVPSDYLDSTSEGNRIAVAADDPTTRMVIPSSLATQLNSEYNGLGQDLEIRIIRQPMSEIDVTLRSYDYGVYKTLTGEKVPNFAFTETDSQVQLGLTGVVGSSQLTASSADQLQRVLRAGAGSIAQIVSVYWFNGANYIRISDPVLTSSPALSVTVRNFGVYQVRAVMLSTSFHLAQGSPYPRVITPNDPNQNNRVFWFFENPTGETVSGTIYDIRGAKVRDLAVNDQSPTSNALVWDGRDMNGAVVPSGVYLYKVMAGDQQVTGTVVVAR